MLLTAVTRTQAQKRCGAGARMFASQRRDEHGRELVLEATTLGGLRHHVHTHHTPLPLRSIVLSGVPQSP